MRRSLLAKAAIGVQDFDDAIPRACDDSGACPRSNWLKASSTRSVIGAFFEVYNTLGFGFLEHIYVMALERELIAKGHMVACEVGVTVSYKGEALGLQRLDMIVDDKVIVETKSAYELPKAAQRQVLNYLRATKLEVGLLLHFGPQANFYRVVCRHADKSAQSGTSATSASTL